MAEIWVENHQDIVLFTLKRPCLNNGLYCCFLMETICVEAHGLPSDRIPTIISLMNPNKTGYLSTASPRKNWLKTKTISVPTARVHTFVSSLSSNS